MKEKDIIAIAALCAGLFLGLIIGVIGGKEILSTKVDNASEITYEQNSTERLNDAIDKIENDIHEITKSSEEIKESIENLQTNRQNCKCDKRTTSSSATMIQVGVFAFPENAARVIGYLGSAGFTARANTYVTNGNQFFSVVAGPISDNQEVNRAMTLLRKLGINDAYVFKK